MHIVDSCGWLEWFSNGRLAEAYGPYLKDVTQLLVPVVVFYEVYKILKREVGEERAIRAVSYMKRPAVIPVEDTLGLKAADMALQHHLAMADALVYAASAMYDAPLYTSDADFKGLPLVHYID